jgi:aspartate aminotransferase
MPRQRVPQEALSPSRRALNSPPSPIRKLEPAARAAEERGVRIYHLNIGQPDIPTAPLFLAHARQDEGEVLAYGPSAGAYPLRAAMARYYLRLGLPIGEEDIIITTGGSEAVLFALMSTADPGDEVLTPAPFYPNYHGFAVMAGVELRTVATSIDTGFALPPIEALEAAVTSRTRAIVLCNPGNPTGALYPPEAIQEIVDLALRRGLFVIADEVYREFVYDGRAPSSILQVPGAAEVAIVVDSLSKRLSACGARVGVLATKHRPVLDACVRFAQARLSPPVLEQRGAVAALTDPGLTAFIASSAREYERRRNTALAGLAALPGVHAPSPGGAFYLMARLPVRSADDFCRWLLEDFSSEGETVMLAPGSGFYRGAEEGRDQVRLAYVLREAHLRRAIAILGEALGQYPGGR